MIGHCVVNKDGKEVEGVLIGVFQKSTMIVDPSDMFGGHQGGVVAGPIAVVRIGDKLEEVGIGDLTLRYREIIPLSPMKSKPYKSGDIFKTNIEINESKINGDIKTDFEMYRDSVIKGLYNRYG